MRGNMRGRSRGVSKSVLACIAVLGAAAVGGLVAGFNAREGLSPQPASSTVVVAIADMAPADETARERKGDDVAAHIKSLIGVTCEIAVKAPGEVPRSEGKAVRVRDLRKQAP